MRPFVSTPITPASRRSALEHETFSVITVTLAFRDANHSLCMSHLQVQGGIGTVVFFRFGIRFTLNGGFSSNPTLVADDTEEMPTMTSQTATSWTGRMSGGLPTTNTDGAIFGGIFLHPP